MGIGENLENLESEIAAECAKWGRNRSEVVLCAVSKTRPIEQIELVVRKGVRVIGENYVSEIAGKFPANHEGYRLRLIGHLQTNKVRKALCHVDTVDSVDSLHLLKKLEDVSGTVSKRLETLIELNTSGDVSKTGFRDLDDVRRALDCYGSFKSVFLNGFMTMGPASGGEDGARRAFDKFNEIVELMKREYPGLSFPIKSFGMTDDWRIAIEKGSNMLRIGRALFGERG